MSPRASKRDEKTVGVERMRGDEMDSYLKRFPTVLYRYQANRPGLVFLLVLAFIAGVSGVLAWTTGGLAGVRNILIVSVMLTVALTLTVLVAYWTYYTRIHYVASSEKHLLLGRGSKVVAIEWDALDVTKIDFNTADDEPFKGVLSITMGDEQFRLRLFNGFIVLGNLHNLMSTLLTAVQEKHADGAV